MAVRRTCKTDEATGKIVPYCAPPKEIMDKRSLAIKNLWERFLDVEHENNLEYYVHKHNLYEVIRRQDQRMHYLKVFHDLSAPCEYKYIAIECFWINTLKPFMVVDNSSSIYDCPNEMFSLFLILSTIRAVYEVYGKGKFEYPSSDRINDILYDFKYCSLSREAMISFVETFADTYGVGIEFIYKHGEEIKMVLEKEGIMDLFATNEE